MRLPWVLSLRILSILISIPAVVVNMNNIRILFFIWLLSPLRILAIPIEIWVNNKPFGQGTLIDKNCVLTAGHCIVALSIDYKLRSDTSYIVNPKDGTRYFIAQMVIPENFHTPSPDLNSGEFHHDWGLIFLKKTLPYEIPVCFKYHTGPTVDIWSADIYRKGESGQGVWDRDTNTLIGVHSRTTKEGESFNTLVTQEAVNDLKRLLR